MIVAVDTREQRAYRFDESQRVTLPEGDYSIVGMEGRIAIERKSKIDALGSLGKARARFEREVQRLARLDYAAIVIECSLYEFLQPHPLSKMNPKAAVNTLLAWSVRYRLPVFFAHDRLHAKALTHGLLRHFFKEASQEANQDTGEQCLQAQTSGKHTRPGFSRQRPSEARTSSDSR